MFLFFCFFFVRNFFLNINNKFFSQNRPRHNEPGDGILGSPLKHPVLARQDNDTLGSPLEQLASACKGDGVLGLILEAFLRFKLARQATASQLQLKRLNFYTKTLGY
jgi:hypothetical protein